MHTPVRKIATFGGACLPQWIIHRWCDRKGCRRDGRSERKRERQKCREKSREYDRYTEIERESV